ncbi:OmpA family protein [Hymenobacter rubripertinctus]|uniref:OmpA family protein n=1 Tax=Hymenobacter rubripertinctus TaxID=2029981 RepID=A0A418R619_9BACT|nr:OmpA family protein [Hymenobacter rubripertinctus]RIY12801.1 OmpA family protein [Hymenobacter rubripertinctus]
MKKIFLPALAAVALLASCSDLKNPSEKNEAGEATADTAVVFDNGRSAEGLVNSAANATEDAFDVTKDNFADTKLEEIDLPEITVREGERLNIYGIDEEVLFDTDKAVIKPSATRALSEISASIARRYRGKQVRVLGFADARGSKDYNMDLARERATAVKDWMISNGMMQADMISIESMGEKNPVATNATPAGRQQNRRVEIAVLK